jgi:acyl-CoA thioester hydrolase
MNDLSPITNAAPQSSGQNLTVKPEGYVYQLRVYYQDTDAGGVVYHARYLDFAERARTEWLAELGFTQTALAASHNMVIVLRSAELDYRNPALLDDWLEIHTQLCHIGGASIRLEQQVWRGDKALVILRLGMVCVDKKTLRPTKIPLPLRMVLGPLCQESAGGR